MGSERMVPLFDPEHASEGMKRRGLFYMKGSSRMFLPAELAGEDIATRLSLLVQTRFGLGLTYSDHAFRSLDLPVIYVGGKESVRATVPATPTHEGFFTARMAVGTSGEAIALQLGAACDWLEITSVSCSPLASLKGGASNDAVPEPVQALVDGMTEHAPGLFECNEETAVLLVTPGAAPGTDEPRIVEVVFRPLRLRGAASSRSQTQSPIAEQAFARLTA